jgi:hypothetical protein
MLSTNLRTEDVRRFEFKYEVEPIYIVTLKYVPSYPLLFQTAISEIVKIMGIPIYIRENQYRGRWG